MHIHHCDVNVTQFVDWVSEQVNNTVHLSKSNKPKVLLILELILNLKLTATNFVESMVLGVINNCYRTLKEKDGRNNKLVRSKQAISQHTHFS